MDRGMITRQVLFFAPCGLLMRADCLLIKDQDMFMAQVRRILHDNGFGSAQVYEIGVASHTYIDQKQIKERDNI